MTRRKSKDDVSYVLTVKHSKLGRVTILRCYKNGGMVWEKTGEKAYRAAGALRRWGHKVWRQ